MLYGGYGLSLIAIALLAHGTFGLKRGCVQVVDRWKPELLDGAFGSAPPDATIRILQTSISDVTRLIGVLEDLLLHKGKQFRLRILLLDFENARDVLLARIRLRVDTADTHATDIRINTELFIRLKDRVDAAWLEHKSGASLSLQTRYYTFLLFGSMFQVGKERIFSGLFWNWGSAINGPMILITDATRNSWKCFEEHFTQGWEQARVIYPQPEASQPRARTAVGLG
jgi:hypothetical protein